MARTKMAPSARAALSTSEPGGDDAPPPSAPSRIHDEPVIELADGATARRVGEALVLADREGRVLVRYENGSAEIAAPDGDLTLAAPRGRVLLRSGLDVEVDAARDVRTQAGRALAFSACGAGEQPGAPRLQLGPEGATLKARDVRVEAQNSHLVTGRATVLAHQLGTTAHEWALHVERYELTATRLVEKTRDSFRDVTDLAQTRVGRMRTFVSGLFSVSAKRASVTAKEETKIDGKKVLLG